MGKAKKPDKNKGGASKAVKPKTVTPTHEEKKEENAGVIGIGIPMSEEEIKRLKEDAKKLDQ